MLLIHLNSTEITESRGKLRGSGVVTHWLLTFIPITRTVVKVVSQSVRTQYKLWGQGGRWLNVGAWKDQGPGWVRARSSCESEGRVAGRVSVQAVAGRPVVVSPQTVENLSPTQPPVHLVHTHISVGRR